MLYLILGAVIILLVLTVHLYTSKKTKSGRKSTCIPGLDPSDPTEGNRQDVIKATHMMAFLRDLHKRFGPIVSFWEGTNMAVSVATPELLKQMRQLKNISLELIEPFRAFFGDDCVGLMNGEEVTRRRKLYDHHFQLKGCKSYTNCFLEIANEYTDQWKQLSSEDHIPLMKTTMAATMKGILRTCFGDYFKDEDSLKHFEKLFHKVMVKVETAAPFSSLKDESVETNVGEIQKIVSKIWENRRKEFSSSEQNLFLDVLLGDDATDTQCMSDSMGFIAAGYGTTGQMLMWLMYEIAANPSIQDKLYDELQSVLNDTPVSLETIPKLTYLRQLIDETLRLRGQATVVGRKTEEEFKLGDYVIPANVNIYQPLGLVLGDPNIWSEPEKFEPERFSVANSKGRHPFAFKPFGFAGKRQCPGQTFALIIITTFAAEWCRQFRVKLVSNQTVSSFEGFIVRPEEEVWVTFEPRY